MIEPSPVSRDDDIVPATHTGTFVAAGESLVAVTTQRSCWGCGGLGGRERAVILYGRSRLDPQRECKLFTRWNGELRPRTFPRSVCAVEIHRLQACGGTLTLEGSGRSEAGVPWAGDCGEVLPRLFIEVPVKFPQNRVAIPALALEASAAANIASWRRVVAFFLSFHNEPITAHGRARIEIFECDGSIGGTRGVDGDVGTVFHPCARWREGVRRTAVASFAGEEFRDATAGAGPGHRHGNAIAQRRCGRGSGGRDRGCRREWKIRQICSKRRKRRGRCGGHRMTLPPFVDDAGRRRCC